MDVVIGLMVVVGLVLVGVGLVLVMGMQLQVGQLHPTAGIGVGMVSIGQRTASQAGSGQ